MDKRYKSEDRKLWQSLELHYESLCYTVALAPLNDLVFYRDLGRMAWLTVYFGTVARVHNAGSLNDPLSKLYKEIMIAYQHKDRISLLPFRPFLKLRRRYRSWCIYMRLAYLEQVLLRKKIITNAKNKKPKKKAKVR